MESRLTPLALARGFSGVDELCRRLGSSSELVDEVVEAMTTNETSFFRDHHPFEALRQVVLPALIQGRNSTRQLNIWCAAASTGQEPYSIALLITEHFPELAGWDIRILATDICKSVLERARVGRFRQIEVNRGMSVPYLLKYFQRDGLEFQIDDTLRKMVKFEELNLIQRWPPLPTFDLVFIRNVLIYFDVEAKRTILAGARRQLATDGYLFLGGSETIPGDNLGFDRLPIARTACYQTTTPHKQERHHA